MKCNEKEQENCDVEKRGCEGCIYNEKSADEKSRNNDFNKLKVKKDEIEKKDKIIDEMAHYLSGVRTCPNEDFGADIDCEYRCSNEDEVIDECWKIYFERKVEDEN